MTTIAYRHGVIAADSRAWSGGWSPIGSKVKIKRFDSGVLLGCASSIPGGAETVIEWYCGGMDKEVELPDSFTLLVIRKDGTALYAEDRPFLSGPLTADYFAIGSGRQYAIAAMACGRSAIEAVQMACKLDIGSDGPIYFARHDQDPKII